jgi:hypothetical protein
MTGRAEDRLTDQQARAAIAAALIRQIHAILPAASPGTLTSPPGAFALARR